ncbi:MAG TPA: hypothetical protein VHO70_03730 [Chitinispirillaceae bacterium]|nr:hypothetical protein [Chitinispirillaceae bacterium]
MKSGIGKVIIKIMKIQQVKKKSLRRVVCLQLQQNEFLKSQGLVRNSGGVTMRILIVAATLLLVSLSALLILKSYRNKEEINVRKVMAISEYGLLHAMQMLREQPAWREGFDHIEYEQGWYSVTVVSESSGDSLFLNVSSEGQIGSVVDQRTVRLLGVINGQDTVWNRF